jgi:hypothetical protein
VTRYYELIDLGMDLDLGVTASYIEGEVSQLMQMASP